MTNKQTIEILNRIRCNIREDSLEEQALVYAISALAEPRWIPCSEKYPDQGERVLVTIGGYDIWVWDRRANRGDDYFWEDEQGFYHNKYEIDAWMPLPEPYREDKE